jgi:hypothetical protein
MIARLSNRSQGILGFVDPITQDSPVVLINVRRNLTWWHRRRLSMAEWARDRRPFQLAHSAGDSAAYRSQARLQL